MKTKLFEVLFFNYSFPLKTVTMYNYELKINNTTTTDKIQN